MHAMHSAAESKLANGSASDSMMASTAQRTRSSTLTMCTSPVAIPMVQSSALSISSIGCAVAGKAQVGCD